MEEKLAIVPEDLKNNPEHSKVKTRILIAVLIVLVLGSIAGGYIFVQNSNLFKGQLADNLGLGGVKDVTGELPPVEGLTSIESPFYITSVETITFPDTLIGASSQITFTVNNNGKGAGDLHFAFNRAPTADTSMYKLLDANGVEILPDTKITLASNETATFKVIFRPTAVGAIPVNLVATGLTKANELFRIAVTGTGITDGAVTPVALSTMIEMTPAMLDFGRIKFGESSIEKDVTIKNISPTTVINLKATLERPDSVRYSAKDGTTVFESGPTGDLITLPAGATKVLKVSFNPLAPASGATADLAFNDANVTLIATGDSASAFTVNPIQIALKGTGYQEAPATTGRDLRILEGDESPTQPYDYYASVYGYRPPEYLPIEPIEPIAPVEPPIIGDEPVKTLTVTKTGPEMLIYPLLLMASGVLARKLRKG